MKDEQFDALVRAIRSISHGEVSGPTGLEMLSMALSHGPLGQNSVASAIEQAGSMIAESHERGLSEIAEAIKSLKS